MKKQFDVYFYNGLNVPEKITTSITGLLRDVNISDNYLGDVTSDVREHIRDYKQNTTIESIDELNEQLGYYDLIVNPTIDDFREFNRSWFQSDKLNTNLESWL